MFTPERDCVLVDGLLIAEKSTILLEHYRKLNNAIEIINQQKFDEHHAKVTAAKQVLIDYRDKDAYDDLLHAVGVATTRTVTRYIFKPDVETIKINWYRVAQILLDINREFWGHWDTEAQFKNITEESIKAWRHYTDPMHRWLYGRMHFLPTHDTHLLALWSKIDVKEFYMTLSSYVMFKDMWSEFEGNENARSN